MTASEEPEKIVVVRRLLPVSREEVFDAWLDPVSLAQWMCPGGVTTATVDVESAVPTNARSPDTAT